MPTSPAASRLVIVDVEKPEHPCSTEVFNRGEINDTRDQLAWWPPALRLSADGVNGMIVQIFAPMTIPSAWVSGQTNSELIAEYKSRPGTAISKA
jgi:hypothetical protein